jgi:hypothetical protein
VVVVQEVGENFLAYAESGMAAAAFPLGFRQRQANLRQPRETRLFARFAHPHQPRHAFMAAAVRRRGLARRIR